MVLTGMSADLTAADLVDALVDPHRCFQAYQRLLRLAAAHALACDRCQEDGCRPEAEAVLPRAIALLAGDESAHVRAMAVEVVGQWVHSHPAACSAIERAAAHDPAPAVRKKASWFAPGGTVYRRTQPRPHRLRPS
jgi:hypothetical protein